MPIRVHVNVNLKNVSDGAHAKAAAAVEKAAFDIEAHAKALAPVDTGFLRAAIAAEPTGNPLRWRVWSFASYSVYQEYGTRSMAAQPYMTPAAELVRPQLRQAIAMSVV